MEMIVGGRGTGKTSEIVGRFQRAMMHQSTGAHLLVATAGRREDIIKKYHLEPFMAQRVVVAHMDCLMGTMGPVFADDLDSVLCIMFGRSPEMATVSGIVR